jgi:hypothetical protein
MTGSPWHRLDDRGPERLDGYLVSPTAGSHSTGPT